MQLDFYEDRLRVFLQTLQDASCEAKIPLDGFLYKPCDYKVGNALPEIDSSFREFGRFERWGGEADAHAWFYKHLAIPQAFLGRNVELCISTQIDDWDAVNPQFIVYVDGRLAQGLDVNHREVFLDNAKANMTFMCMPTAGNFRTIWNSMRRCACSTRKCASCITAFASPLKQRCF